MTADHLIKELGTVPSLPAIFDQITQEINDPSSSTNSIGDVIAKDSGLTARLLKIANSAFYNFPTPIDTISQAVIVIGIQQLKDLALGTSVIELFDGISDELVNMDSFWQHSVACGIAARVLATHRREANVERYFVAGLLHDLGRLLIYMKVPEKAGEALKRCRESGELFYKVEREVLGFTHAEAGAKLMELWKLPANLIEAVLCHHQPSLAVRFPRETALIHVADIVANAMQLGSSGERFVPPLLGAAWDGLGLSPSVIAPTLSEIERQFDDSIGMFLQKKK